MALDTWTFQDSAPTATLPIGDYTYREGKLSGTGSLGDNPQATRVFLIDGEMLPEFTDDVLGFAEPPNSIGGNLKRTLPEEHPTLSYFFATDLTFKPLGVGTVASGKSEWPAYEVTVTYRPLPYGVYADDEIDSELERFVSVDVQSKAEYLTANNTGMQFVSRSTNKAVQTSPGVIVPSAIYQYTWHCLPAPVSTDDDPLAEFVPPNASLFTRLIGSINATTFHVHPPHTMALIDVTPVRLMPRVDDGLYLYDLTFTFDVRNHGEDDAVGSDEVAGYEYIYDIANKRWDKLTVDGTPTGATLFEPAEFADLFRWGTE